MPQRFNLETTIATWRQFHERQAAFSADDLDELERHVRDVVAQLVADGTDEAEAFRQAMQQVGDIAVGEAEYSKVYRAKVYRQHGWWASVQLQMALSKNYLLLTLRHLRRHPGMASLNLAGLALGVMCCAFILLYVQRQYSYDRYHDRADDIYRLTTLTSAKTSPAWAPALEEAFGQTVEHAVRFWPLFAPAKMAHEATIFVEDELAFADPGVFSVFNWSLLDGEPTTALVGPHRVVVTETLARKYFGEASPLGEHLTFWGMDFEVTGVMTDVPETSHYRMDALFSFASLYPIMGASLDQEWASSGFYTYVRVPPGVEQVQLDEALAQVASLHGSSDVAQVHAQPLTAIHRAEPLQGEPSPGIAAAYLHLLGAVALFVMILACINFINLTVAGARGRIREIGVRKMMGAAQQQIQRQFLGEALVVSGLALGLGSLLVIAGLPVFNTLVGTSILGREVPQAVLLVGGALVLVVVGIGLYPAASLSRFKPAQILKGAVGSTRQGFRQGLIVFQFAVLAALLVGTLVVLQQTRFLQQKDLGFAPNQVLVLDGDRYPLIKQALREVPSVQHVAGVPQVIGAPLQTSQYRLPGTPVDTAATVQHLPATLDFIETMGVEIVAGRAFSADQPTDADGAVVLNEAAARAMGWGVPDQALGQSFEVAVPHAEVETWAEVNVIGVVRDFHYGALHHTIQPLILYLSQDLNLTLVRLHNADTETLAQIEAVWQRVNPDAPYNAYFLDQHLAQAYIAERQAGRLFAGFTGLALVIACLGLLGLSVFTVQQRVKEIGVRKVLGASPLSVMGLLSKEVLGLVTVALFVGLPIAYMVLQTWLSRFAYRIELGIGVFALTALGLVLIAILTVSYQSGKAALADPVKSLRYE
ncbi:MAG: ABC transporter permease [Rhodothermales bacterium]